MYTALVTGGGNGIGRAIAVVVARMHYNVGVVDVNPAAMAATLALCEAEGVGGLAIEADVRNEAAAAAAVEAVSTRFGGLDMLVCNAGIVSAGRHWDLPIDEWHRLLDINLLGAVRFVNAALPHLRRSSHARIVLVGSSQAIMPNNAMAAHYVASKFALRGYAEAIRPVMASENILLHFFCPGLTATDFPVQAGRFGDADIPVPDLTGAMTVEAVAECLSLGARARQFLISTRPDVADVMHRNIDDLLAAPRGVA